MRKCVREEIGRALRSRMFWGALLIGFLFSAVNIAESLTRAEELHARNLECLAYGMKINMSSAGFSLFISWIALHATGLGSNLFYFLLPVLAALPYGWSYNQDRRSGYYAQAVTRMGKRRYFAAKYTAVFVSGGLIAMLPVAADLLVCAMLLPDQAVRVNNLLLLVLDYSFASVLLYTRRWLYALIWCAMTFLWGGTFACMCFLPGTRLRLSALVTLTPFALLLGVDALLGALQELLDTDLFSVQYLVWPGANSRNPGWAVLTVLAALILLTAAVCWWRVTRHELE